MSLTSKFCSNLHSSLLILFAVCVVQFLIVFHVAQVQNESRRESQLTDLLKAVQEQNLILRRRNAPVKSRREAPPPPPPQGSLGHREDWSSVDRCATVHVAIVCAGYTSARTVVTLLKSVLFHRRSSPLRLHLLVDPVAGRILDRLLTTWAVPSLTFDLYPTGPLLPSVAWVKNSHYSGVYGLAKLLVPEALPDTVSKVLVLDTDITFNSDIAELWHFFTKFNGQQAIGIVENQSNWYLGKFRWPALGQGFNSGVILMDLKKLRSIGWRDLWKTIAAMQLQLRNRTALADQDVFNAVLKQRPSLCFELPCEWNVQLNERATIGRQCVQDGAEPKAVHWNTFQKSLLRERMDAFFRRMYLTFAEYDGNLLRKELVSGCGQLQGRPLVKPPVSNNATDRCEDMRRAGSLVYRTHVFFLPFDPSDRYPDLDVTFVTQLSLDRMLMLETLAMQWAGPISAAVFGTDAETRSLMRFVSTSLVLRRRRNIAYHVVYKDADSSQALYPVNFLRNVAMEQASTPFVLLADVDFVPKLKMRDYLLETVKNMSLTAESKVALVLPPFETSLHRFLLPITKKLLLALWERSLVQPFRFSMWKPGQYPVNYTKWKTAQEPYEVEWSPYFEPFVMVPRDAPRFDPRFVGFGWNKVAHAMALHAHRYKFVVLPRAFIVHLPHGLSMSNNQFRLDYRYRRCMNQLKQEFVQELMTSKSSTVANFS